MIAAVILVISLGGAMGSITATSALGDSNRESTIAYQAARAAMERLLVAELETVVAMYNDDGADDPAGPNTAPGSGFDVPGLDPQAGDADQMAGRILLPLSPDGTIREDLDDATFGMPRDLTGDGFVDGLDRTTAIILLPVRVRVEWSGRSGDRFVEYTTLISTRQ